MPEVVLRPAEEEDIAEMLALYAPYVIQTTVSSEYDAPSIEEFTRRWRTYTQKLPWLVCRIDGEVVGYGYAAPHRTRAAYQWSVETSIYVAQEQPIAISQVSALRNAAGVRMSRGLMSFSISSMIFMPACFAR